MSNNAEASISTVFGITILGISLVLFIFSLGALVHSCQTPTKEFNAYKQKLLYLCKEQGGYDIDENGSCLIKYKAK